MYFYYIYAILRYHTFSHLQLLPFCSISSKRWKISVEVKSKSKTIVSEKRGTYFKVTLMDGSGTINAKAFGSQSAQKFFKQFEENKVKY